jgi:Fic family protein
MNDNIFSPQFNITHDMGLGLESIDRNRWLIDNALLIPKHEVWLRRDVSARRSAGTTAIENVGLEESEVSELQRKGAPSNPTEAEQANVNALRAYEFIDYLSDQHDIPIDELAIRHMNREFLYGAAETLTPGVYRRGQNRIGGFTPPDQGDVPGLMRGFALWLRQEDDMHPVIRAGLAHLHFVAIHPFWDCNGRTARGLTTLILQRSPSHFKKLLSLEQHLAAIRERYISAIEQALGPRFSLDYDATSWLEFFVAQVEVASKLLKAEMTDWHRMMQEMYQDSAELGLNTRQTDGLAYAARTGKVTRGEYVEITGVAPLTASRDLSKLVELGLLRPEGKTRSRIYYFQRPAAAQADSAAQPPLFPQRG